MSNNGSDEDMVAVLEDIRRWIKIVGLQEGIAVLNNILTEEGDPERERALRITYHLTNGSNSNDDIAHHIKYSSEFVRLRQNEWADLGLLERDRPNEPYTTVITLEEAGIEVPEIPDNEETDQNAAAGD